MSKPLVGGTSTAAFAGCAHAQKCHAERNGALGYSEAYESLAQSAVGFPVFPRDLKHLPPLIQSIKFTASRLDTVL